MKFLIIKHIDIEGPGTFGDFLREKSIGYDTVELGLGERLPQSPQGYEAVVVLGGPMNVYEENKYCFLSEEDNFIKKCLKTNTPYLGLCLGSQLLAKASGAKVTRSPVKEIGWYNIQLTGEGVRDPLLRGFLPEVPVFHWHEDMFNVPQNGVLLATASGCPHQAFRAGTNAYGVQFHVEVTGEIINEWYVRYAPEDFPGERNLLELMLRSYALHKDVFLAQSKRMYDNFLQIVQNNNLKKDGGAL